MLVDEIASARFEAAVSADDARQGAAMLELLREWDEAEALDLGRQAHAELGAGRADGRASEPGDSPPECERTDSTNDLRLTGRHARIRHIWVHGASATLCGRQIEDDPAFHGRPLATSVTRLMDLLVRNAPSTRSWCASCAEQLDQASRRVGERSTSRPVVELRTVRGTGAANDLSWPQAPTAR